jgi:hypothetical protein
MFRLFNSLPARCVPLELQSIFSQGWYLNFVAPISTFNINRKLQVCKYKFILVTALYIFFLQLDSPIWAWACAWAWASSFRRGFMITHI